MGLPNGATIGAIMIGTDKTKLSNMTGDKEGYPVYMTIANIHKGIRSKLTSNAWMLVGYLPIPIFMDVTKPEDYCLKRRVFHDAMRLIFAPLANAAPKGIYTPDPSGLIRRLHPILFIHIADHPEQTLIAGTRNSVSPVSTAKIVNFGDADKHPLRHGVETQEALHKLVDLAINPNDAHAFCCAAQKEGYSGVFNLYWANWIYADPAIFLAVDCLHTFHKFYFDHVLDWVKNVIPPEELDFRAQCLQPRVGFRQFRGGICKLKNCTGREQRDLERIVVALSYNGKGWPSRATAAIRALTDFIYLGDYKSHTEETISYLVDALREFHHNKDILIQCGARTGKHGKLNHFQIPKLEMFHHVAESIRQLGSVEQYTADQTEHLHIPFCKEAYKRTNRRGFYAQMCRYADRIYKVRIFWDFLSHSMQQDFDLHGMWKKKMSHDEVDELVAGLEDLGLEEEATISLSWQEKRRPDFFVAQSAKQRATNPLAALHFRRKPHMSWEPILRALETYKIPQKDFAIAVHSFLNPLSQADETCTTNNSPPDPPFLFVDVWKQFRLQVRARHDESILVEPQTVQALPPDDEMPFGRRNIVLLGSADSEPTGFDGE